MAEIYAVGNQKGGSGKTTTAVNLAACCALGGRRVLLVDMDPQANATTHLGVDRKEVGVTVYDVLVDAGQRVEEAIVGTKLEGLWVVPSDVDLSGAEMELADVPGREVRLREALGEAREFDVVLIDCPPSLGLLTVNALTAAEKMIVPVETEFFALEGLAVLSRTVELVREALNPRLEIVAIVPTKFDRRKNLCRDVVEEMRELFGKRVTRTIIRTNVRLAEAPTQGEPVELFSPGSHGAEDYRALAREVLGCRLRR